MGGQKCGVDLCEDIELILDQIGNFKRFPAPTSRPHPHIVPRDPLWPGSNIYSRLMNWGGIVWVQPIIYQG